MSVERHIRPRDEPRLTIELVPATCWFSNVRTVLSPRQWDALRSAVYAAAGWRCEVCGGRGKRHPVDCHKVWGYDDARRIQRRVRVRRPVPRVPWRQAPRPHQPPRPRA
jgi:hypothetical protein